MQIDKMTISNTMLLDLFIQAITSNLVNSSGKELTLYRALGHLVGIDDRDAVERANNGTEKEDRITVKEFRLWLPTVFSEFARVMLEASDETR